MEGGGQRRGGGAEGEPAEGESNAGASSRTRLDSVPFFSRLSLTQSLHTPPQMLQSHTTLLQSNLTSLQTELATLKPLLSARPRPDSFTSKPLGFGGPPSIPAWQQLPPSSPVSSGGEEKEKVASNGTEGDVSTSSSFATAVPTSH